LDLNTGLFLSFKLINKYAGNQRIKHFLSKKVITHLWFTAETELFYEVNIRKTASVLNHLSLPLPEKGILLPIKGKYT
jgi:hypothetical protein